MKGDEIIVINGAIVGDLDMMFIESVLQEELTLCMMLRSSRKGKFLKKKWIFNDHLPLKYTFLDPPRQHSSVDIIESLVCPPPPIDNSINEDAISSLIVPAPGIIS